MKKRSKKISLKKETVRNLGRADLRGAAGGTIVNLNPPIIIILNGPIPGPPPIGH